MKDFNSVGLPKEITRGLEKLKFTTPTPIQAKAIPLALDGRDILGSAQTGTGKTLAFGLPLLAHLFADQQACGLVITPTRELATQVLKSLREVLGSNSKIKAALMIGGDDINKQLRQLKEKPRLFVGTPGRINDHLKRGSLKLSRTSFLVLDETDRMLDMGFSVQIEQILQFMPEKRQTLLFSATLPKKIAHMAQNYMQEPVRIAIGAANGNPADHVKQEVMMLQEHEKYDVLLEQLEKRSGSIIIFMKTKYSTEKMAKRLRAEGHSVDAIHGDLRHNKRARVIKAFHDFKYRILVATDIAARGLDIPHIEHVINYNLPQCPEDYIHRIGRTARAGAEGEAICLLSSSDRRQWREIEKIMDPEGEPLFFEKSANSKSKKKSNSRSKKPNASFAKKKSKQKYDSEDRPAQRRDRPAKAKNPKRQDNSRGERYQSTEELFASQERRARSNTKPKQHRQSDRRSEDRSADFQRKERGNGFAKKSGGKPYKSKHAGGKPAGMEKSQSRQDRQDRPKNARPQNSRPKKQADKSQGGFGKQKRRSNRGGSESFSKAA